MSWEALGMPRKALGPGEVLRGGTSLEDPLGRPNTASLQHGRHDVGVPRALNLIIWYVCFFYIHIYPPPIVNALCVHLRPVGSSMLTSPKIACSFRVSKT